MTARAAKFWKRRWRVVALTVLLASTVSLWGADAEVDKAEAEWRKAGSPGEGSPEGDALVDAAIHADRPELVDQVLVGGDPLKRLLPMPRGGQRVPLHIVHEFKGVHAQFSDEMFASMRQQNSPEGWLARRITKGALEVWTPQHGWLFDGRGRLRNEAHPPRRSGWGREWYGAFLPDGRWVTTDLDELDGTLSFFSPSGKWLRALTCEQLAPPPSDGEYSAKLLGWGRSDREGKGWVVNVGSEEGWATVWVGPNGPARVLKPGERWALCYPRALGPRGMWVGMSVPDDAGRIRLSRGEASHGARVGYPDYDIDDALEKKIEVADGDAVFGFWPSRTSFFIGAERYGQSMFGPENSERREVSGWRTRKFLVDASGDGTPLVDKTWFFDSNGKFVGWMRARRIGDAADGRSMLFRVTADGRIATMGPDLRVKAMRRFVWSNRSTADAVVLWDDLRMGIFVHHHRLLLAKW